MMLCDCCKDPSKVIVARYIIEPIPTYEHDRFRPPNLDTKDANYQTIDLCQQCKASLADRWIGRAVWALRQGPGGELEYKPATKPAKAPPLPTPGA